MHSLAARLPLTLLFLVACTIKSDSDPDATSTGEGAETSATLGNSSAPTPSGDAPSGETDPPGGTEGPPDPTRPTDGTTVTESGDDSSGGDSPSLCEQLCQHISECQPGEDPGACATLCEAGLASAGPDCLAATVVMQECFVGLGCEHLAIALDGGFGHPCNTKQFDRDNACGGAPDSCDTGGGGARDGSACMVETQCPDAPLRRMQCDTQECVCLEDEVPIGSCPAEGACLAEAQDQLGAKALDCCGFPGAGP